MSEATEVWESPVKKRLHNGEPVIAATITVNSVDVAAHAATMGFDFLWIEMEHSPITLETLRNMVLATRGMKTQTFARVPVCGLIAQYNATGPAPGPNLLPATMRAVLSKSLTLRGYINYEFAAEHYAAFLRTVGAAVADGRIRYREDITDGFENAPAAFIGMLEGRNFGKALVRVTPSGS